MKKVKSIGKKLSHGRRMLANEERMLPHLICVGARKGGTTSLFHYLVEHPQIIDPFKKEIHYFDRRYRRPFRWYESFFPLQQSGAVTLEASTSYSFYPKAIERLKERLPDTKLVFLLRDPMSRAFSNYQHNVRRGIENRDFKTALLDEMEKLKKPRKNPDSKKSRDRNYSYLHRGLYSEQVENIFKHYNRDQVFFIKNEDFYHNTQKYLDEIYSWLNLQPFKNHDLKIKNASKKRKYDNESYEIMKDFFRDEQKKVIQLLGDDFDWGIAQVSD